MKIGSKVRLIGIPPKLPEKPDMPTQSVFKRCLGHEFVVAGFNDLGMAELRVESVTGSVGETIWVETEFLELLQQQ